MKVATNSVSGRSYRSDYSGSRRSARSYDSRSRSRSPGSRSYSSRSRRSRSYSPGSRSYSSRRSSRSGSYSRRSYSSRSHSRRSYSSRSRSSRSNSRRGSPPGGAENGDLKLSAWEALQNQANVQEEEKADLKFYLTLRGLKLAKVGGWGWGGKSKPYFQVSYHALGTTPPWQPVYTSEAIEGESNPQWKPANMALDLLCDNVSVLKKRAFHLKTLAPPSSPPFLGYGSVH